MAYTPANLTVMCGYRPGPLFWRYYSTDAETAFDDTDYITDAGAKGMETGDAVLLLDTTNGLTSLGQVTVDADGNGTVTAFTAL